MSTQDVLGVNLYDWSCDVKLDRDNGMQSG